jgi:ribose transport system permease protein
MLHIDLENLKKYAVMGVLLFLVIFFAFFSNAFLTTRNLTNIITQNTFILFVAIGLSFVMIGGGIDLSVGFQMSLVGVVTSISMLDYHHPIWFSVLLGLLLGTFLGFINGMIIAYLRIFPLLATIATGAIFQGASFLISNSKIYHNFPAALRAITQGRLVGIPLDILLALLALLFAAFIYSRTVFGFRLIALGGNEEGSRLAGINTRRMKIAMYTLCGFSTAIATMLMLSRANFHSSTYGPGTEITVLTAAIIGGISFAGGEGGVAGLVAGVFILAVIGNGMQLAGWGTYPQSVVKGVILLGAVIFDEYQKMTWGRSYKKPPRLEGPKK